MGPTCSKCKKSTQARTNNFTGGLDIGSLPSNDHSATRPPNRTTIPSNPINDIHSSFTASPVTPKQTRIHHTQNEDFLSPSTPATTTFQVPEAPRRDIQIAEPSTVVEIVKIAQDLEEEAPTKLPEPVPSDDDSSDPLQTAPPLGGKMSLSLSGTIQKEDPRVKASPQEESGEVTVGGLPTMRLAVDLAQCGAIDTDTAEHSSSESEVE